MRIRKSQAFFSSMSLSDPQHLINRSPALVQLADAASPAAAKSSTAAALSSLDRYRPSDQLLPPIGKLSNGCDDPPSAAAGVGESGPHWMHSKQEPLIFQEVEAGRGDSEDQKGNHTRKGCIFGSQMQVDNFPPPPSLPSTQDGRWDDGEKTIPLKKRRGGFENNSAAAAGGDSKNKKPRMKTKMNKKCSSSSAQNDDDNVERVVAADDDDVNKESKKKKVRGSALMEGSRCSRVNGRGWRCCQPTLVGYSLCEHHLGKGRLRSMASVKNRSMKKVVQDLPHEENSSSCSSLEKKSSKKSGDADYSPLGKCEKKPAAVAATKKRMKLGTVKARSMSSLLGETSNKVAAVVDENNK